MQPNKDENPFIQNLVQQYHYRPVHLLSILRRVQAEYHYIPDTIINLLADLLSIPRTRIVSVVEFYSFLHLHYRGRVELLLSDSITDHMLGKQRLIEYLAEKLNVAVGDVREDGLVSLDNTSCTGMCDQGPAGLVNGLAVTRLDEKRIDQMVDLINLQVPLSDWPQDLFQVDDNIVRTDLLLDNKIDRGAAINAGLARGLKQTLSEIQQSGLRGRGGAGFKTALKWRLAADEPSDQRYVVCNADEGEPGTFKDRVLLASYAHQVLEGMTLCAAVIGAQQGLLYLRAEYLYLFQPLQDVLTERRQLGLLGRNICQQGMEFDIEIRMGAGAYICGEESALIESLEGKVGIPRIRPPYPVTHGYLNKPTVVDNVETFFAVSYIAVHGAQKFAVTGTEQSTGTKLLSVSGDCQKPGIYEYPFGVKVMQVLQDCAAEDVLGVQVGGPSGSFIGPDEFDRNISFEDLPTGGSFMVFNRSRNLLGIVRNFSHFFAHESCGFCTPCREGTQLLADIIDKYSQGKQTMPDNERMQIISQLMKTASHCGLGQTAANPILTTLAQYPECYTGKEGHNHE